ncbi:MAG: hypothetical protein JO189_24110 [Deltaproteobacteria bacterium]|nr:hypothetical protein [Deltaproteobacteria bacterium]
MPARAVVLKAYEIELAAIGIPVLRSSVVLKDRKFTPTLWMGLAFGLGLAMATGVFAIKGTDEGAVRLALRVTARWSFVLFWFAYTGSAMTTLFGPAFAWLGRRGREFGLAYAAAQLIHVGLVAWLFQILSRLPLSGRLLFLFTVAIVWTYLLAFLSFGGLGEALGPRGWRTLRIVALNYILFAFATDFVPAVFRSSHARYGVWLLVGYVPFAMMSLAAPVLVLAASARRGLGTRYSRATALALPKIHKPA